MTSLYPPHSTFDYVGKLLAVGTYMGTTTIYNLETRELLCELCNNSSPVRSLMFSHDTSRLTTVCNRQAIVWDVASTMKIRTYDFVVDKEENGAFQAKKPHIYRTTVGRVADSGGEDLRAGCPHASIPPTCSLSSSPS